MTFKFQFRLIIRTNPETWGIAYLGVGHRGVGQGFEKIKKYVETRGPMNLVDL